MDINSQKGSFRDEVLTLGEVASYLKVSEKTVLRMIRDRRIPCAKVSGQWRFVRAVVDDWLLSKMAVVPKNDLGIMITQDCDVVPLSRLVSPKFVLLDIQPGTKRDVLEQLTRPFVEQGIVGDKRDFLNRLMGRERMVSTSVGRGVAIPHVRNPRENSAGGPLLCIGVCKRGTDYEALDGVPTRLFFLVYTDSEVVHLRVMAKIAGLLSNEEAIKTMLDAESPEEVLKIILREDQKKLLLKL